MQDSIIQYGLLGALAIALLVAAFMDIMWRKIPNWLNLAIALGAPLFWWANGVSLWPGVAIQFATAIVAFAVFAVLFALRWMGGGDVKLLTALALWVAPAPYLKLLVLMALIGGVVTVVSGVWHIMRREKSRLKVPYGVAISAAALIIIGTEYLPAVMASPAIFG